MHIDHNQLLELLVDTSGIEPEKAEQQVSELVEEIKHALADGEAYEIEGFGIFSSIGNRTLFIPSKELETEINFKYVGMEPIELEEDQVAKEEESELDEDPFADLQEMDADPVSKRNPFEGLVDDFEESSSDDEEAEEDLIFGVEATRKLEEEEFKPGPEEWGIEAHKEGDKGANKLLSSLMGEDYTEPEEEETPFDDIFGEEDEEDESSTEESVGGLDAELSNLMSDEVTTLSTDEIEAGITDDDFTDIFGEETDDEAGELEEESELDTSEEELIEETETLDEALDELISETEEEEPIKTSVEEIDMDDFDDPFLDLEEELSEESEEELEDVVPVITNISSGIEPTKKEEPKPKKEKPEKKKKDAQPAPVWLWIVLGLVLVTGTTLGLGYFSIINIPGITPQVATTVTSITPPPVTPPVDEQISEEQPDVTQQEEEVSTAQTPTPPVLEQETEIEVPTSKTAIPVPADQNKYGMMGVVNESANDGYTIVLYSLSVQSNAVAKQQELTAEGYRTLVMPIASEQYGTLWRVSIGQFASLTNAAIASESMDSKFKQSYFIKRITN
tara:strand:- start:73420 stop:75108 length:1689 start_codon:yes stop_codon:yes gene_type:complete